MVCLLSVRFAHSEWCTLINCRLQLEESRAAITKPQVINTYTMMMSTTNGTIMLPVGVRMFLLAYLKTWFVRRLDSRPRSRIIQIYLPKIVFEEIAFTTTFTTSAAPTQDVSDCHQLIIGISRFSFAIPRSDNFWTWFSSPSAPFHPPALPSSQLVHLQSTTILRPLTACAIIRTLRWFDYAQLNHKALILTELGVNSWSYDWLES